MHHTAQKLLMKMLPRIIGRESHPTTNDNVFILMIDSITCPLHDCYCVFRTADLENCTDGVLSYWRSQLRRWFCFWDYNGIIFKHKNKVLGWCSSRLLPSKISILHFWVYFCLCAQFQKWKITHLHVAIIFFTLLFRNGIVDDIFSNFDNTIWHLYI